MQYKYDMITAEVVAKTRSKSGVTITSLAIQYPRFILAEVNTHRVLSRSTASSRAIPLAQRIQEVRDAMYVPASTIPLINQRGMKSTQTMDDATASMAQELWARGGAQMAEIAEQLATLSMHKQHANRILEPWVWAKTIVTATEWDNFFSLRRSSEAQPEFEELAHKMFEADRSAVATGGLIECDHTHGAPRVEQWHLPFIDTEADQGLLGTGSMEDIVNVSAARCARVSYMSLKTGKRSTLEEDKELARSLLLNGHMSPFDHPGYADVLTKTNAGNLLWANPDWHRQYYGWVPARVEIEYRSGKHGRRQSHAPVTIGDLY